jgi:predicted short-subunit dehydrogenase-like oxidoreductase (DUF2520 family)
MCEDINSIVIIGSGNIAWHFNKAFSAINKTVSQVVPRKESYDDIVADLIVIAIADKAIVELYEKINPKNSIVVHTSGFMEMDILKERAVNYGVFYPLQSLKKGIDIDSSLPLCIEANNEETFAKLKALAEEISSKVYNINTQQRQQLHLAAIFANNFTNHLFGIARAELEKENIPFEILFPLIDQTIAQIKANNPFDVQTGVAKRNEQHIISAHKAKLDEDERELYTLLTDKIIKKQINKR